MTEDKSFRTALRGFNKVDVIDYIEKLMKEKAELEQKNSELEKELQRDSEVIGRLRRGVEKLSAEAKKESEKAAAANAGDLGPGVQTRLGSIMLDASRFSQMLIDEADGQITEMYNKAVSDCEASSHRADELSAEIRQKASEFVRVFGELFGSVDELSASLKNFGDENKDMLTGFSKAFIKNKEASSDDIPTPVESVTDFFTAPENQIRMSEEQDSEEETEFDFGGETEDEEEVFSDEDYADETEDESEDDSEEESASAVNAAYAAEHVSFSDNTPAEFDDQVSADDDVFAAERIENEEAPEVDAFDFNFDEDPDENNVDISVPDRRITEESAPAEKEVPAEQNTRKNKFVPDFNFLSGSMKSSKKDRK